MNPAAGLGQYCSPLLHFFPSNPVCQMSYISYNWRSFFKGPIPAAGATFLKELFIIGIVSQD